MNIRYKIVDLPFSCRYNKRLTARPHMHKAIEMIYMVSGSCVAVADNKRFTLQEGDLYISFPDQIHYYHFSQPIEVYIIIFYPEMLYGLEQELMQMVPENNVIHIVEGSRTHTALDNLIHSDPDTSLTVKAGYLNLLMADAMTQMTLTPGRQPGSTTLKSILNYCENHYRENLTLEDASATLHISTYHISRLLNKRVGKGFSDYINSLRINEACSILESYPNRRISDVSEAVGFGSIRSFNRAFQKVMKTTPVSYKKLISKETG